MCEGRDRVCVRGGTGVCEGRGRVCVREGAGEEFVPGDICIITFLRCLKKQSSYFCHSGWMLLHPLLCSSESRKQSYLC